MVSELIDDFEDYLFAKKINKLDSTSLIDIFKLIIRIKKSLVYNSYSDQLGRKVLIKILLAKLYTIPELETILIHVIDKIVSENDILNYIKNYNIKKLGFLTIFNDFMISLLMTIQESKANTLLSKKTIIFLLNRCRFSHNLLKLLLNYFELAKNEVCRSFEIYKTISKVRETHEILVGGSIYFLFLLFFEAFSPELYEYLKIALTEFEQLINLDPACIRWNTEANLIYAMLEVHIRCDQNAIERLLNFTIFESKLSSSDLFYKILFCYLKFDISNNCGVSEKIIEKYGNPKIFNFFIKSIEIFKSNSTHYSKKNHLHLTKLCYDNLSDFLRASFQNLTESEFLYLKLKCSEMIFFKKIKSQNHNLILEDAKTTEYTSFNRLEWILDLIYHLKHENKAILELFSGENQFRY